MNTLGWGKIYLAYGMIFFSLGLLGRLSQPELWGELKAKAGRLWEEIRVYADLPGAPLMEIPVFQEIQEGQEICFFYPSHIRETHEDLWREIHQTLSAYAYPRELILNPLKEDMIGRLLRRDGPPSAMFIGLRLEIANPGIQVELAFKFPETVQLQPVLAGLRQLGFNHAQIRRFRQRRQEIYQLQWFSDNSRLESDLRQVLRQLLERGGKQV